MRTLYFDCFSGISGDMTVGALIDLGVPQDYLLKSLNKLRVSNEYTIRIKKNFKTGIAGTSFEVVLNGDTRDEHNSQHPVGENYDHCHDASSHFQRRARNYYDIEKIIKESTLNDNVKSIAGKIFLTIAQAESKVHNQALEKIHFHEVGAVDSIIDIASTAIAIDYLKPDRIRSSRINTGKGFVKCAHGIMPVPAPAVLEILKNIPVYSDSREFELTTPTGAGIIKTLASDFGSGPELTTKSIGYGYGKRDTEIPNVLRIIISEDNTSDLCLLETTIDDMNPQIYGYLMQELFSAGAKDVYYTSVYMKKNRPGVLLTVVASLALEETIKELIFKETTTIGIKRINIEKSQVKMDYQHIETQLGEFTLKTAKYNDHIVNMSWEYEELAQAAKTKNIPLKQVYSLVNGSIQNKIDS